MRIYLKYIIMLILLFISVYARFVVFDPLSKVSNHHEVVHK